jgi:hypothetical protein
VRRKGDALVVSQTICKRADAGGAERESASQAVTNPDLYFRVRVTGDAMCEFSYGVDGAAFTVIGEPFQAKRADGSARKPACSRFAAARRPNMDMPITIGFV